MDGSLGHRVYRKPTHTNLYLHQKSHHHPANKQSVLSSLIHRAIAIYDQESLAPELTFLTHDFKQNGYSHQQIQDAAERTPLFEKRINSRPKKIRQMFFYFWN